MSCLDFKSTQVLKRFCEYSMHPLLADLLDWWQREFGEAIVTSAYRPKGKGVHSVLPYRGLDVRCWIYASPDSMEFYTNSEWIYDPKRPNMRVCMLHNTGKGKHFHLQVHDRTVRNLGRDP